MTFRAGAVAISIKTANLDTSRIDILNCEFHNQTTACIRTDSTSNSTCLVIQRNKFVVIENSSYLYGGGYVGYFERADQLYFDYNWVTCDSPTAFYVGLCNFNLYKCLMVPLPGLVQWIDNYGAHFEPISSISTSILCASLSETSWQIRHPAKAEPRWICS